MELSTTADFNDFNFLKEILRDKRIVFLGENSHGVSEFNSLKSKLIRYLHEELDFDIVAFECNAGDAFAANLEYPYENADAALFHSVSTFWHVQENISLFEYINQSRLSSNPLHVAGIDITQSNGSYAFSRFLKSLISPVNPVYAENARYTDSLFTAFGVRKWTIGLTENRRLFFDSLKNSQLIKYQELIDFISKNKENFSSPEKHITAAIFYLQSRINFIHQVNRDSTYMADFLEVAPERNKSIEWLFRQYRERLQSENLKFLAHELFPDKKIIVWAQNTHIEKVNRNRMPFRLAETDSVYTIGLFNYSGRGCFSFGQGFDGTPPTKMIYEYEMPNDSLRLEQILVKSGYDITFVDMKYQYPNEGNSWMFGKARYAEWDGLILIKEISPPKYLKFDYDYLLHR